MATDNKEFQWRPNDNSSSTRMRYDLEAEHWTKAFKSAQMKQQSISFGESLSVIGTVINLTASLVLLVILCIVDFVKWVRS
jgi:hypothetical protein